VVAAEAVERRATLIVCGTRGLGALPGVFLGSFTQRLLHLAPCPVLAVRAPDAVTAGDEPAELHTQV
jgi:nucleotide-binding universal stress UspA family protein